MPEMFFGRFINRKSNSASKIEQTKVELISLLSTTAELNVPLDESRNAKLDSLLTSIEEEAPSVSLQDANGKWALLFVRNAEGAPYLQDLSNSREAVGGSFQTYNIASKQFYNTAELLGGRVTLSAAARFRPAPGAAARIDVDIESAALQIKGLPRIPLPLKVSGGWLEFLYVDQDMQVARGNAGGVFVLVRPRLLESLRAQPA